MIEDGDIVNVDVTACIGGVHGALFRQIEQIRGAVELPFLHAELFREYELRPPRHADENGGGRAIADQSLRPGAHDREGLPAMSPGSTSGPSPVLSPLDLARGRARAHRFGDRPRHRRRATGAGRSGKNSAAAGAREVRAVPAAWGGTPPPGPPGAAASGEALVLDAPAATRCASLR